MNPRICICCGEAIHTEGNTLSRNPNICASCSSMADGMEDVSPPGGEEPGRAKSERAEESARGGGADKGLGPVTPLATTQG